MVVFLFYKLSVRFFNNLFYYVYIQLISHFTGGCGHLLLLLYISLNSHNKGKRHGVNRAFSSVYISISGRIILHSIQTGCQERLLCQPIHLRSAGFCLRRLFLSSCLPISRLLWHTYRLHRPALFWLLLRLFLS